MNAVLKQYPTGFLYIEFPPICDWHNFPVFARKLLREIDAKTISDVSGTNAIDAHWYEFNWNGNPYRLVYEDYPHEISIESLSDSDDLKSLCSLLNFIGENSA